MCAGKGASGALPPAVSVTFLGRVLLKGRTRLSVLLEEVSLWGAARTEEEEEASRTSDARVEVYMVWLMNQM